MQEGNLVTGLEPGNSDAVTLIIRNLLDHMSSNKMIADKLFVSLYTVKNHKRNMMEKTGTRNFARLIIDIPIPQ